MSRRDSRVRVELLVIQPTSFCNLDCVYCYVPERINAARMQAATLRRLGATLARSRLLAEQSSLEVLWHAGEPLAAGLAFYREADSILHDSFGDALTIQRTFQTNGTMITSAWCRYFVESHSHIGVSLDGPRDIHDAHRRHRHPTGSFDQVMRGVGLLHEHGIGLNVLCVLTRDTLKEPDRLYDFFRSVDVETVGFNVEEVEGEHLTSSLENSDEMRASYVSFMDRFLARHLADGTPMRIREFQVLSQHLWNRRHDRTYQPQEAEHYAGRIITVSRSGEVHSWSPELASGVPGDPGRFSLGNVHDVESMDDLIDNARSRKMQAEILRGIERCRQTCHYFNVCGGGSPANKMYENGSFDSTATVKCRLQVQALTDVILRYARQGQ